jgi:WD40 repeat protein
MQSSFEDGDIASGRTLRVFVSYSRRDTAFVVRLAAALTQDDFLADYDQAPFDPSNIETGIAAEDEWWQRLQQMITAADVMVFVVSPSSAASKVCDEEIAYARGVGKRIIAVQLYPIDFARAPPRLSALNIAIDFEGGAPEVFHKAYQRLVAVLQKDVAWHRELTRLTGLAHRWATAGRPSDRLLSSADLEALGSLLERRPSSAPDIAALLLECREQSQTKVRKDDEAGRRTIGLAFVKPAREALDTGRPEQALRIAAAGAIISRDIAFALTPELWSVTAQAASKSRSRYILNVPGDFCGEADYDPLTGRVACTASDNSILLWNPATQESAASFKIHEESVTGVQFSPNGRMLATTSRDYTAKLWSNLATMQDPLILHHDDDVGSALFSSDGTRILTSCSDGTARIWSTDTGALIGSFGGYDKPVSRCKFLPGEAAIAIAVGDHTLRILDIVTNQELHCLSRHSDSISDVAVAPGSALLVTASQDGTARCWDASTGVPGWVLNSTPHGMWSAACSSDGSKIATGCHDNFIRIWDAATGRLVEKIETLAGNARSLRFINADRQILAACSDGTVRILDAALSALRFRSKDSVPLLNDLAFSSDGRIIAYSSFGRGATALEAETGAELYRSPASARHASSLAITSDGSRLAVSAIGAGTTLHRLDNTCSAEPIKIADGSMDAIEFSRDGTRLICAEREGTVKAWDLRDAGASRTLLEHTHKITVLHRPLHASKILAADTSGSIAAINVDSGSATWLVHSDRHKDASANKERSQEVGNKRRRSARGEREFQLISMTFDRENTFRVQSADLSPDGKFALTAQIVFGLRIWDPETRAELKLPFLEGSDKISAALSLDGSLVAAGTRDGELCVLDAADGSALCTLPAHAASMRFAAWSADCSQIATGMPNEPVKIWDVARVSDIAKSRALTLVACLAMSSRRQSWEEKRDLLLSNAPSDLFKAAYALLEEKWGGDRASPLVVKERVDDTIARLRGFAHPHCYMTPSQCDQMFGAERGDADRRRKAPSLTDVAHLEKTRVEMQDLDGQEFIEAIEEIPIFRLRDGRYHIVSHFAVPSLEHARVAARWFAEYGAKSPSPRPSDGKSDPDTEKLGKLFIEYMLAQKMQSS